MIDLPALWNRAVAPEKGFAALAAEAPSLGTSVGRLLLLRSPLALVDAGLLYWALSRLYRDLVTPDGRLWNLVLRALPLELDPGELRAFLDTLPPLPHLGHVLFWLVVAAPLYVLSLWFHDAVWDHTCLWMLRGTKRRSFRTSLLADSEALQVGVFGAALGLLTNVPVIGWMLALPVGLVGAYFWILRGIALAAFHGCPSWKGIVATILHVVLMMLFAIGMVLLVMVVFAWSLA